MQPIFVGKEVGKNSPGPGEQGIRVGGQRQKAHHHLKIWGLRHPQNGAQQDQGNKYQYIN